jgi:mycofactocin system creatininase family protein
MAFLADLTWPAVDRTALLAVPVGSTEQHGPHLPLSTDTDVAVALAGGLARERGDVLVAPAVAYGSSGEHAGFAGTLSIGQQALELLLVELVRSACDTFARVLLVSAHGGNLQPVTRAVTLLRSESRDVRVHLPRWAGEPHAGRTETAMLLALSPDRVLMERAEPGNTEPITDLLPRLRSGGVRAVAPNGVLGDPVAATAQEGEAMLDELTAVLVEQADGWWPR